jgi:hypothetical protein
MEKRAFFIHANSGAKPMTTHKLESEILFIRKIMEDSRKASIDNGKYYILWGIVIGIASIGNYLGVTHNATSNFINWIWLNCILLGWGFSIYFGWKDSKKEKNVTFARRMLTHTWLGAGITMCVLVFFGLTTRSIPYDAICPIIAAVLGGANYISSMIHRSKFLLGIAIGWWAGSAIMFLMTGIDILLVYGVLLILFSVVPGLILYYKWKRDLLTNE